MKQIKDEVKRNELQMKIESQVATSQKLIDMLKKNLRILHISCHGIKDGENQVQRQRCKMGLSTELVDHELEQNYLLFETPEGQGELINAA